MPPKSQQPDFQAYSGPESALEARWNIFNAAAKKDLHWWFFALLMIGMGAFAFLYYDMRTERESLRKEILEVRNSQLAYVTAKNDALMSALLNNTRALEANTQTLNRIESRRTE
jgi:hypothetical protein